MKLTDKVKGLAGQLASLSSDDLTELVSHIMNQKNVIETQTTGISQELRDKFIEASKTQSLETSFQIVVRGKVQQDLKYDAYNTVVNIEETIVEIEEFEITGLKLKRQAKRDLEGRLLSDLESVVQNADPMSPEVATALATKNSALKKIRKTLKDFNKDNVKDSLDELNDHFDATD